MTAVKPNQNMRLSLQNIIPGVLFSGILMVIATNQPTVPVQGQLERDTYSLAVEYSPYHTSPYPVVPETSQLELQYYPPLPTLNSVMP